MTPTDDTLGQRLLVPVLAGCPPDLAARITSHNAAAVAWQGRHDRLEANAAAARNAVQERVVSPETAARWLAAVGAEWQDIIKEFRFLLVAREGLVDDIKALAAAIDRKIIESLGPEIAAAQRVVRWSGWPWRVAGRG